MVRACLVVAVLALAAAGATAARADCLPIGQTRALIQSGELIPLVAAVHAARQVADGEMIDGRLCGGGDRFSYLLTFLRMDGRVARVQVDARSGAVLGVR